MEQSHWKHGWVVGAALAVVVAVGTSAAWAQKPQTSAGKQLVGVWKLVSAVNTGADGVTKTGSFGPNPAGMIIFTSSGHYASVSTHPDLPKFASGNRLQGTADEYKAVVHGSNASYGTYSVSADGKVLTLKVEGGTWAHWVGKEQNRDLTLKGDDMKYSLAASRGGRSELVFKRIK